MLRWDAWGKLRSQAGSSFNLFGFTGHQRDEATGLYYFGARFYDPELGRFLTEDPFGGEPMTPPSLHRYLYAYANPTVYWDPTGACVFGLPCPDFLKKAAKTAREKADELVGDVVVAAADRLVEAVDRTKSATLAVTGLVVGTTEKLAEDAGGVLEAVAKDFSPLDPFLEEATRVDEIARRLETAGQQRGISGLLDERGEVLEGEASRLGRALTELPIVRVGVALVESGRAVSADDPFQAGRQAGRGGVEAFEDALLVLGVRQSRVVRSVTVGESTGTPGIEIPLAPATHGASAMPPAPARSAVTSKGGLVIGRMEDLTAPGALAPGERTLLPRMTPSLGSPKANWKRNSSLLRQEMRQGEPIRDGSATRPDSELAPTPLNPGRTIRQTFTGAERNLLREQGWTFDGKYWIPPNR